MNSKILEEVKNSVKLLLEEKELSSKVSLAEVSLTKASESIAHLIDQVETKESALAAAGQEIDSLKAKVSEIEALARSLQEKFDSLQLVSDENLTRATKAESELVEIAAQKNLEVRVAELASAKVTMSGDKFEVQKNKIKGMSDTEFATYKEDLIQVRADLETSLKAAASAESENTTIVAPADLDAARKEVGSTLLNIEMNRPTADIQEKMAAMMAEISNKITKEYKRE
jgi:hypothetical protein